jgi:hypothetical protein
VPSSSSSHAQPSLPSLNDRRPCHPPRDPSVLPPIQCRSRSYNKPGHSPDYSRRFDYLWHLHIAASGYVTIPRLLFKSYAHPTKAQRRQQDVGHLRSMQGEHAIRLAAILTTILYRIIPSWMDTVVDVKSTSGHLSLCCAAWRIVTSSGPA